MIVQVAGDHEAVAAVVPLAATHGDRPARTKCQQQFGGAPAGVFHEDSARHAELLDGPAVQGADLVSAEVHQAGFSMSDCVLMTVCSSGKVWKADKNRHPARAS